MELTTFQAIPGAFLEVCSPEIICWIFLGVILGIIFGAAPGLTATTAVALFTPVTFYMPFDTSLGLLMGIYCGGFYAGSIPAILIKTPGAPGNAATVLDGYPMAQQGRAGAALTYSIVASWIGGTISAFALLIFAPLIGMIALKFGAPEYFAIAVLGLVCISGVSGESMIKGIAAAIFGMLLGAVGMDPIWGITRFTFDNVYLMGGVALIPALVGLFAVTEVLMKAEHCDQNSKGEIAQVKYTPPQWKEYWQYKWLLLKSTVIGIIIGAIPGTGPTIASWISYNEAKRTSKHPEKLGTGVAEGILASESSNNAVTGGALIPLLTLGVPGDTVTAVLLGALMIQGVTPGPTLITEKFDVIAIFLWLLIIANIFMLIIGLIGCRFFPYILRMSVPVLLPIVTVLCVTGGYAVNNSFFDVYMLMFIGIFGMVIAKFGFPIPPIVLGMILGPIIEPNFRRALMASGGNDYGVLFSSSLSLILWAMIIGSVALLCWQRRNSKKRS